MWRKVGCIALIVLVLLIVAAIIYKQKTGGGTGGFFAKLGKKEEKEKESYFEAARKDDLVITVDATGTTEPITDIDVKSEATGRIIEFYVEEGDQVKKGDLICKLDQSNQQLVVNQRQIALDKAKVAYTEAQQSQDATQRSNLQTAVDNAQTNLKNAQDSLETAKAAHARIAEMHGKGYASDQELENSRQTVDSAEAAVKTAQSNLENAKLQLKKYDDQSSANTVEQARLNVDSAKVALAEAQKQLGDSVIVSPINGIILEKQLDVGDSVVSINSSFGGSTTIVRVADLSRMKVRTNVDEIDIGKIKLGQQAKVNVDAHRDVDFSGKVTNIFPQGVTAGTGLVNFIVIVEVDNSEGLLLGNMTADVSIEAQHLKDVLLIPLSATRAGKEPDTDVVYVLKDDEDEYDKKSNGEEREVKLGDTDYKDVVVLDGLKEGEKVKVRGFEQQIRFE